MAANRPQVDIQNEDIPEEKQPEIHARDEFGEFDEGNVGGSQPIQRNPVYVERRAGQPANEGEQGMGNEPNQGLENQQTNQTRQEPM